MRPLMRLSAVAETSTGFMRLFSHGGQILPSTVKLENRHLSGSSGIESVPSSSASRSSISNYSASLGTEFDASSRKRCPPQVSKQWTPCREAQTIYRRRPAPASYRFHKNTVFIRMPLASVARCTQSGSMSPYWRKIMSDDSSCQALP